MKKILITIILLFATLQSLKAQGIQILDTPPDWTFMMSNLNTAQITSGILYNKVAMSTNLLDYNRGKYNLTHADHFMQGINELYYASGQTKFMSASQLKNLISGNSSTLLAQASTQTIAAPIVPSTVAIVDISVINTTLHQLNFNEKSPATGGLTFVNEKFVSIAGQPAFLSRKILLASPLQENVTGTAIKYKFSNALIYNNATTAIKKLIVYFSDNTAVTIINNSTLVLASKTINYSASGSKLLRFVATFTDNTTITTGGYHYFTYKNTNATALTTTNSLPPCEESIVERGLFKSNIGFQGYDEPTEYLGKFDYTVFYHTKNNDGSTNQLRKMLKPIIIIDGFDPGDKRKTTDCDCEQDKSDDGCFIKNSTKSFVTVPGQLFPNIQFTFNSLKYESIIDLMFYDFAPNDRRNLINLLREEGYDVVILNIPKYNTSAVSSTLENKSIDGGADYVERNGRALASYLQATKSKLVQNLSLENIVIMGPSMGGLISRYALAYMEKRYSETSDLTWKHNTRIWVSFDSPHLGANIPMGAQANIWFFGEKLRNASAEEKFNKELNSYAGKQMLISQFSNTLATMVGNTGYSNNSPYFVQFQNNLNSNGVAGSGGFPVSNSSFRKIAIVNGSLNGAKNGVEGGEFLNVRGYKDPNLTEGFITGAALGAGAGSIIPGVGTLLGGLTGGLLGGLFGSSNANVTVLRCRDKFYPAYGQTDDIFNGDGQNFTIGWSQWYINHKWYNLRGINNDLRGSLDVVPAGTYTTGKILRDEIVKGLDEKGLSSEIRGTNIDTHSFIPAFSALGHLQPYQSWSNPLNTNLACATNKQTPFDSYYGANINTPHISLTKEMVDWLMKEIGDSTHPPVPQAPWFPLQPNLLTGSSTICLESNTTISFGDICKLPSAVTWTVTPNIQIITTNSYNIVVKGITGGTGTITARFQNGQTYTKNVWVGKPTNTILTSSSGYPYNQFDLPSGCGNYDAPYWIFTTSNPSSQINEYQITFNGETISKYGDPITVTAQELGMLGGDAFQVVVTPINDCGFSTGPHVNKFTIYKPTSCQCGFGNNCNLARISNTDNSFYKIYPNPTTNIINVDLKNQYQKPNPNATIIAELYNMMGEVKRNVTITNNIATIDVSGLPREIYLLKINIDGVIETHQVGVE